MSLTRDDGSHVLYSCSLFHDSVLIAASRPCLCANKKKTFERHADVLALLP